MAINLLKVIKNAGKRYKTDFLLINGKKADLHTFLRGNATEFDQEISLGKNNKLRIFFVAQSGAALSISINQGSAAPPPEVSFHADPTSIMLGDSSTLTWTTTDAESVAISPGIGSVELNGTTNVTPTATTEYVMTATGPGGTTEARATVSVTIPAPTITLHATPTTIAPGESSRLSWSSTTADACNIVPDIGTVDCNGSTSVTPTASTFRLRAENF